MTSLVKYSVWNNISSLTLREYDNGVTEVYIERNDDVSETFTVDKVSLAEEDDYPRYYRVPDSQTMLYRVAYKGAAVEWQTRNQRNDVWLDSFCYPTEEDCLRGLERIEYPPSPDDDYPHYYLHGRYAPMMYRVPFAGAERIQCRSFDDEDEMWQDSILHNEASLKKSEAKRVRFYEEA